MPYPPGQDLHLRTRIQLEYVLGGEALVVADLRGRPGLFLTVPVPGQTFFATRAAGASAAPHPDPASVCGGAQVCRNRGTSAPTCSAPQPRAVGRVGSQRRAQLGVEARPSHGVGYDNQLKRVTATQSAGPRLKHTGCISSSRAMRDSWCGLHGKSQRGSIAVFYSARQCA